MTIRAVPSVVAYGSGGPQRRDGLYDVMAGAESFILSPGLNCSLELGGPMELCFQPIDVDQARPSSDSLRIDHKEPARDLVDVTLLSRIVRAKFRDVLRQTPLFALVPGSVWRQAWVVHCQPVGNGFTALKHLAPYIFRVAISNNRILKLAEGKVTFRYPTTDTGKLKICTLPAQELIRRFLQHVLPKGFV